MWFFIFGALILAAVLGNIYLVSRFAKFSIVHRAAKDRKVIRYIIAAVVVLLLFSGTWLGLGSINAMIIIIHLMVIWLLCDGINGIIQKRRKVSSRRYYAGVFALGLTVVYLTCGWYLAHHVWRTEYVLTTDKQVGSLCIVLISDSHVGTTFHGEEFAEHIKSIQSENPDIVVVVGDFVDDDTSKEDMISSCEALGTLQTTFGVYYVFGNHDKGYYGPAYRGYSGDDLITELEKNHVVVLQDQAVLLDDRFYLIGRQDRSEEQRSGYRSSMTELVSGLEPDKYTIVLDHQPSDYAAQTAAGVDLVLSGHTHGGQLFPINYMGQLTGVDDKTCGLEMREFTNFIVTSGISDWAIKFKTGCKSEYVVIVVQEQ